jgi:hypothetical protein
MIVDKKIDLNIYKERDGEAAALKTEGKAGAASCCAPSSACCQNVSEANAEKSEETLTAVADLDFNEWVSKYHQCPV